MGGQRLSLLTDCGGEANAVDTNLSAASHFVASACLALRAEQAIREIDSKSFRSTSDVMRGRSERSRKIAMDGG